jgi:hypothetical protein
MSTDTTPSRKKAYRTQLQLEFRQLTEALDSLNTSRVTAGDRVSENDLAVLERSLMTMRTQMRPLINDSDIIQIWEEHDIDRIPVECAIDQTTTKTHGETGQKITETKTVHAPPHRLEYFAEGIMRVYVELGFAPEREDSQTEAHGDYSDILEDDAPN